MKPFISILIAFQVLLSSMSFSIGTHFCGGELKSLALFGEATPCNHSSKDGDMMASCPFHKKENKEDKKNCCEDEQFVVKGLDIDTPVNLFHIDLSPDSAFNLPNVFAYVELFSSHESAVDHYLNYKPPLLKPDIPVLNQSFLI